MEKESDDVVRYTIPHNYKNNGRIFNLFEKNKVYRGLIWAAIAVFFSASIPVSIMLRFLLGTLLAVPPVLFFLTGFDDLIMDYLRFSKRRKVYYNVERSDKFESLYEKEKARKRRAKY